MGSLLRAVRVNSDLEGGLNKNGRVASPESALPLINLEFLCFWKFFSCVFLNDLSVCWLSVICLMDVENLPYYALMQSKS